MRREGKTERKGGVGEGESRKEEKECRGRGIERGKGGREEGERGKREKREEGAEKR